MSIELALGLLGVFLALLSLWFQYRDRARLKIIRIQPSWTGSRAPDGDRWDHRVTSLEVLVENRGSRAANRCVGLVVFAGIEGLPLYRATRQGDVDTSTQEFSVEPHGSVLLVAAWKFTGGAIAPPDDAPTFHEFLESALPLTVTIECGKTKTQKRLTQSEARAIFERRQAEAYSAIK